MFESAPVHSALRAHYIQRIMSFRDEPEIGDFFAEYYLVPLLELHGGTLEYLPDDLLYAEYSRATTISGFLSMGLISGYHTRHVAEMSTEELRAYTAYCVETCETFAEVDLNDPPEWLACMKR